MRAVVQRVRQARVEVDGQAVGAIDRGLLVYIGFSRQDTADDRAWTLGKILHLRLFEGVPSAGDRGPAGKLEGVPSARDRGPAGKMDLNVTQAGGAVLLVSQFTLCADLRKGRRPSLDDAMPPEQAEPLYERCVTELRAAGARVESGRFRAHMSVFSINDGPLTFWIDSSCRPRVAAAPGPR